MWQQLFCTFSYVLSGFSVYFLISLAVKLEPVINNSLSITSWAADITSVFKTSLFPLMPSVLHPLCQIVQIWDIWKVLYLVRILLINYFPKCYCLCNYKWAASRFLLAWSEILYSSLSILKITVFKVNINFCIMQAEAVHYSWCFGRL